MTAHEAVQPSRREDGSLGASAASPAGAWLHTQPLRRAPLDEHGVASKDPNELSFDLRPRTGLKSLFTQSDWQQLVLGIALACCALVAGEVLTYFMQAPRELRWGFSAFGSATIMFCTWRALQALLKDAATLAAAAQTAAEGAPVQVAQRIKTGALADAADGIDAASARMQTLEHTQRATANAISTGLRKPLARMRFSATYLEDAHNEEERSTAVANLREDLSAMEELVEASLLFARLSQDRSQMDADMTRESFAIKPWIAKEADTLRPLGAWVRLKLDMETIPAAAMLANADRKLLSLALRNIIRNAQRHAESTVMLTARIADARLQIDVDDDGNGVPPEDRERVFEPFSRLQQATVSPKNDSTGTGLGLAIARRVTRLHGGDLIVEDSILNGARLRFSIKV